VSFPLLTRFKLQDILFYSITISVVTDAIKYVQGQMDHLNKSEKALLQDIKQKEDNGTDQEEEEDIESQKTTNGIF
jgi:hypothetical protein